MKFSYNMFKFILLKKEFIVTHGITYPKTNLSSVIQFIFFISVMFPIFMNYFAFYLIIKESYHSAKNLVDSSTILGMTDNEITNIENTEIRRKTQNIDLNNYLKI